MCLYVPSGITKYMRTDKHTGRFAFRLSKHGNQSYIDKLISLCSPPKCSRIPSLLIPAGAQTNSSPPAVLWTDRNLKARAVCCFARVFIVSSVQLGMVRAWFRLRSLDPPLGQLTAHSPRVYFCGPAQACGPSTVYI